jgi:hypothetical protein
VAAAVSDPIDTEELRARALNPPPGFVQTFAPQIVVALCDALDAARTREAALREVSDANLARLERELRRGTYIDQADKVLALRKVRHALDALEQP